MAVSSFLFLSFAVKYWWVFSKFCSAGELQGGGLHSQCCSHREFKWTNELCVPTGKIRLLRNEEGLISRTWQAISALKILFANDFVGENGCQAAASHEASCQDSLFSVRTLELGWRDMYHMEDIDRESPSRILSFPFQRIACVRKLSLRSARCWRRRTRSWWRSCASWRCASGMKQKWRRLAVNSSRRSLRYAEPQKLVRAKLH